jgi:hypothetical protein
MHPSSGGEDREVWKGIVRKTGMLALGLFILGFCLNVYKKEPWTIPTEYGLYSKEDWDGRAMQWIAKKAQYRLPAGTEELVLHVVAQPFNSESPEGLSFLVTINDTVIDQVKFFDGEVKDLRYDLSPFSEKELRVILEVDRIFSPKEIGLSKDPRKLGVAIGFD